MPVAAACECAGDDLVRGAIAAHRVDGDRLHTRRAWAAAASGGDVDGDAALVPPAGRAHGVGLLGRTAPGAHAARRSRELPGAGAAAAALRLRLLLLRNGHRGLRLGMRPLQASGEVRRKRTRPRCTRSAAAECGADARRVLGELCDLSVGQAADGAEDAHRAEEAAQPGARDDRCGRLRATPRPLPRAWPGSARPDPHPARQPPTRRDRRTGPAAARASAYVKSSAAVSGLCTPLTVTRTLTVPEPGGLTAVHVVALAQPTARAAALPKWTTVPSDAVLKPVPVIVTAVLPAAGPPVGRDPRHAGLHGERDAVALAALRADAEVDGSHAWRARHGAAGEGRARRLRQRRCSEPNITHVVQWRREEVRALDRDDGALRTCGRGDGRDRRCAEVRVVVGGRVEALLPVGGDANARPCRSLLGSRRCTAVVDAQLT